MKRISFYWTLSLLMGMTSFIQAHVPGYQGGRPKDNPTKASLRNDCAQAKGQTDLEINNVRARLLVGGDVWWNGNDGRYIVPKPPAGSGLPEVSSIFAGAVWLGGFDDGGNLKLAVATYGTSSGRTDFYPGPLSPDNGTTNKATCANWDRFFKVLASNIDSTRALYSIAKAEGRNVDPKLIPRDVLSWPGRGNIYFGDFYDFDLPDPTVNPQGLGYFFDQDQDGLYDPTKGDYPAIEIRDCEDPKEGQYPDEMIFWIYNDNGGPHTQSNGDAIQMEIQVQAFAYATNDELNDMTFLRYKLINRAIEPIDSTYFAMWADPDLGCYTDDYVGCDTTRSLGYVYNQDALDGNASCNDCFGVNTYCTEIPLCGIDYFRGPLDEQGFELGMSSFMYYNNGGLNPPPPPGTADPSSPIEYYNYLTGRWRDGTPLTIGGSGYNPGTTNFTKYAFSFAPDAVGQWSMADVNLGSGDRRTLQASGPFRLLPGTTNELIVGMVWVPNIRHPRPSLFKLQAADDLAQALFDNCFDITDGPDAPNVDILELDKELILVLSNQPNSNNYLEAYSEVDLRAPSTRPEDEISYKFEGYKIFQLAAANVSLSDLDDPDKARLVYQVDVKNNVSKIFNWVSVDNPNSGQPAVWTPEEMVTGENKGIRNTFRVTSDQFALGDRRLVNHRKYYFLAVAYAYNNWGTFEPFPPISGQRTPYLEGRRNISTYVAIPRPIKDRALNSVYGEGAQITRLEGLGSGSNFLDLTDDSRNAAFAGTNDGKLEYKDGAGPFSVNIYNPYDLKAGNFELTFVDENMTDEVLNDTVTWTLLDLDANKTFSSQGTIDRLNERIFPDYGFSVIIEDQAEPGSASVLDEGNGAIGARIDYKPAAGKTAVEWYSFIPNNLQLGNFNAGVSLNYANKDVWDPKGNLRSMGEGVFVPYQLLEMSPNASPVMTPAWQNQIYATSLKVDGLAQLNNVDIVLTPDKTKWSRCVVVETATKYYKDAGLQPQDAANPFDMRKAPSVGTEDADGDGKADPDGTGTGFGWFPGYAIDVETGRRLNIFFGENSAFADRITYGGNQTLIPEYDQYNTRDMMWNPSSQLIVPNPPQIAGITPFLIAGYFGGQHMIYVTDQTYDQCADIASNLSTGNTTRRIRVARLIRWAGFPVLTQGTSLLPLKDGLIPTEAHIKLRVNNPYATYKEGTPATKRGYPTYRFSISGDKQANLADSQPEYDIQLDAVNVVPNPYYGYSEYETSQFTNTVKVTNLPARCDVTIYSLDGKFIRQYKRNEERALNPGQTPGIARALITPALEWDLKNDKGIPVASGVYLIHINAPGLGERVIKWFGVARQFDPSGL